MTRQTYHIAALRPQRAERRVDLDGVRICAWGCDLYHVGMRYGLGLHVKSAHRITGVAWSDDAVLNSVAVALFYGLGQQTR